MLLKAYLIAITLTMTESNVLFDFTSNESTGKWNIINDGVMGGVSTSSMNVNKNKTATFKGTLSPDNNGGFASVRARLDEELSSEYNGVVIRIKGDGNVYSLRFRTNNGFDGMAYQAKFKTLAGEWKEFKIPLSEFRATYRGRELNNKPKLESKNIRQVGILIADYQFGDFKMDLDWIKFY